MAKNIVFSAREDHEIIKSVINRLTSVGSINLYHHDPTREFFYLSNMPKSIKLADFIIVKVRNECSIDLLHFAKINNIQTLHDVDTVLMCKNKVSLDYILRKIFKKYNQDLTNFSLPKSWTQNLNLNKNFKEWALPKLPLVIKSHFQHDKYNRFNFLVQKIEEVDIFCKKYQNFLNYDVYIQKFIPCDGIERKIYVIGDQVFGVKRENPIYIFLKNNPRNINTEAIARKEFKITEEIKNLAHVLSKELNLKIFGFDLIKTIDHKRYYLIDLNDFPGFRGIKNVEKVLSDYLVGFIQHL